MKNFKEFLNESRMVEASEPVTKALDKAKIAISKLVYTEDYTIEAFLMFADGYSNEKEALKELENLGSHSFQHKDGDKWDSEGYEGPEYSEVYWGDLAELNLADIKKYKTLRARGITKSEYESVVAALDKI